MKRSAGLGTHALCAACALCWLGSANGAAASELVLEWNAPPECPDRDELESRVNRLVGNAVTTNLAATTEVKRIAGTYRAHVRITSAAGFGERELENTRCELLADSVALVVALSAGTSAESTNGGASEPELAVSASAHASAALGPLPDVALGVGGAVALEGFSSLQLELRGGYYVPQTSTFDERAIDGGLLGARFRLLTFGARGCRFWRFGALELAPCVGAELYHVEASGFGGAVERDGGSTWWGPAAGLLARLRLTKAFAIRAAADGVVPLSRRRFVFADLGPLHRASALALHVLVGPEVRF